MGLCKFRKGILIVAILISCFYVQAQWVSGGSFGSWNNKSSGTTWTFSPSVNVPSGALIVICLAADNTGTTDGIAVDLYTCDIDGGIGSISKSRGMTNGQSGAENGATCCIFRKVLLASLTTSHIITITFAGSSVTAKAATAWYFTKPHGNTHVVDGNGNAANDGADPQNITVSSLPNTQHIAVRVCAHESDAGTMSATDGNWTLMTETGTTGGAAASNMEVGAEFRIVTATSVSSDPTYSAVDHASAISIYSEVAQASFKNGILFSF